MTERFDLVIVGAGIVGLATARTVLERRPGWKIGLLEKERTVGSHQTGHNSGVVHSGAYYSPGSLKAQLCLRGRDLLLEFAQKEGIPARQVGKVVVAVHERDRPGLTTLAARARENGIRSARRIGADELRQRLPGVAGVEGLDIPTASIIDYATVARRLALHLEKAGVSLWTSDRLMSADRTAGVWRLSAERQEVRASLVVNCSGLQSDLVARTMGIEPPVRIVPFRGDFYHLAPRLRSEIPCLVYPVPDPRVPFLGVHLTPTVAGELLAGPNAALAFDREGYRPWEWSLEELWRSAVFPGNLGLGRNYGPTAAREWLRSWSPSAFLAAIQTLWPSVTRSDLGSRTSGVRAQAVRPDGTLVDDFVFVRGDGALHVLNAPSPAATASFAIAERIADEAGILAG